MVVLTQEAVREEKHRADEAFCRAAREPAEAAFARRHKLLEQSRAAWDRGEKARAKELSDEAKRAAAEADRLSMQAASRIFALKNDGSRVHPLECDLHGLQVVEALGFAKARLDADAASGAPSLVLIYGAGQHSAAGKQKLKPAILELLRERQLSFEVDFNVLKNAANAGCVSVTYAQLAPATPPRQPSCSFCSIQ
jgi:hypothetical protein